MAMPTDVPIIDCMIGFPIEDKKELYAFITRQTKDAQSKDEFSFPVEYMFKDVPDRELTRSDDPVAITLAEMDHWGVEKGMISLSAKPAALRCAAIRWAASVQLPAESEVLVSTSSL